MYLTPTNTGGRGHLGTPTSVYHVSGYPCRERLSCHICSGPDPPIVASPGTPSLFQKSDIIDCFVIVVLGDIGLGISQGVGHSARH